MFLEPAVLDGHLPKLPSTARRTRRLPVLCDEICDELRCEMSRDGSDDRRSAHAHVNGRPTSRFAAIRVVGRTELRCDAPQVQRRYADRASPRPNSS